MHVAASRTIASVGSMIFGSSRCSTRTSPANTSQLHASCLLTPESTPVPPTGAAVIPGRRSICARPSPIEPREPRHWEGPTAPLNPLLPNARAGCAIEYQVGDSTPTGRGIRIFRGKVRSDQGSVLRPAVSLKISDSLGGDGRGGRIQQKPGPPAAGCAPVARPKDRQLRSL
jgi:hypothetical protein